MIDDNDFDIELMSLALLEAGLEITLHVGSDGERGLAMLDAAGRDLPLPALIFLDLNIPRINGLDLLTHARTISGLQVTPLIILSGSLNPRDEEAALQRGATAYYSKPHSFADFLAMGVQIARLLGDVHQTRSTDAV